MRDTIIRIEGREWWKRTPLQIGDPALVTLCRQLAQLQLLRLSRDAVVISVQNGGRSQVHTFSRLQLRSERGYRALYYWDAE